MFFLYLISHIFLLLLIFVIPTIFLCAISKLNNKDIEYSELIIFCMIIFIITLGILGIKLPEIIEISKVETKSFYTTTISNEEKKNE